MKSIRYKNQDNIGGIKHIRFFAEDEVEIFGDIIDNEITEVVFLNPTIAAANLDIIEGTFEENDNGDGSYNYEANVIIPRDEAEKITRISQFDNKRIIYKIIDANGESRMIGEPGNGCDVKINTNRGSTVEERNRIEVNLSWKSDHRAPFANDVALATASIICDNPKYGNAAAGTTFTTSIDITSDVEYPYPAKQNFTLEGLGTITVEKTIQPGETKTFTVNFELPPDYILEN